MEAIDLYGRNPDFARTTFAYPYPLVSDTPSAPGKRYFFKPPQSNPVFGVDQVYAPDAGDKVALLDPHNRRYRSQRESGGMGSYPVLPSDIDASSGVSGVSPNVVGSGLAGDLGLGNERFDADAFVDRVSEPFRQSAQEKAVKKAAAKSRGWGAVDSLGSFYTRSSGPAQVAMLVVGGLIVWNIFRGRR